MRTHDTSTVDTSNSKQYGTMHCIVIPYRPARMTHTPRHCLAPNYAGLV